DGQNYNIKNAAIIEQSCNNPSEDFTFAVVTDSHSAYDKLGKAVDLINGNPEVKFVFHLGDFTETGLLFQYEQTIKKLQNLKVPFLTVIGNHDTLGNGFDIFRDIFGTTDFSFTCNGVFFFVGNNNNWESPIGDVGYVKDALTQHQSERYRIIVAHIPMDDDDRFSNEMRQGYKNLCEDYNIALSLHGHRHRHQYVANFTSKTAMLVADAIIYNTYYLIHVKSTGIEYEIIPF
ncbi:MAG TPA: metallophosphoesterase, partial [Spirochaetota bacterium]|nr:metallophosphoesterase [Spirochaetota bacterium]HPP96323.1 metallophosphoesterase [Spirochaetota bacterium]